jgi:Leucine-rich repeat (LRR) protein
VSPQCSVKRCIFPPRHLCVSPIAHDDSKTWLQTLYLSSNGITTLEGLQQFTQLQTLSVVGNKIQRFVDLEPLQACKFLVNLNTEGNPLCRLPFYRCVMVVPSNPFTKALTSTGMMVLAI